MRRTKEDAEKTKLKILNAATDLFSTKGFQTTSLVEIADSAGVTRGAIYWHFQNKGEIFEALQDRLHRNFVDFISQDLEKDYPEPLQQMKELCINLLLDLDKDKQKRQALTLFIVKSDFVGELACLKACNEEHKKTSMELLAQYLMRAKHKGFINQEADINIMVMSINCYMKGILYEYLSTPDTFDIKKQAPKLMDMFFANF